MEARAITRGERIFAETVAIAKEKEWVVAKILQRKGFESSEGVFLGDGCEKRLGANGKGFEFVAADGESKKSEVDGGGAEALEEQRRDFLDDGDFGVGEFARKRGEVGRKQIRRDGRDDSDRDGTAHRIALLGEVAASCFEFAQDGAGAREKGPADFGEADGAAETVEEAGPKLIFELADLLRERGLRDVGLARGAAEGAGINDCTKVAELVKFHRTVGS